jgi:hypothetical protein
MDRKLTYLVSGTKDSATTNDLLGFRWSSDDLVEQWWGWDFVFDLLSEGVLELFFDLF